MMMMKTLYDSLKTLILFMVLLSILPPFVSTMRYYYREFAHEKTKVGYLPIQGIVYNSTYYTKQLKKFFKDPAIKAVLMRIESPGISAGTAESIAREIELLKTKYPKPIVAQCENICIAGAYCIAASTDYIIALPSSIIGGIGLPSPYQFKVSEKTENNEKNIPDKELAISLDDQQFLTISSDNYQNFIEHVARHRPHIALSNAQVWANKKLFIGKQALKIGLIDELGSWSSALSKIKELGVIEKKIELVESDPNFLQLIGGSDKEETNSMMLTLGQVVQKLII